jgi:hypothetical protein
MQTLNIFYFSPIDPVVTCMISSFSERVGREEAAHTWSHIIYLQFRNMYILSLTLLLFVQMVYLLQFLYRNRRPFDSRICIHDCVGKKEEEAEESTQK